MASLSVLTRSTQQHSISFKYRSGLVIQKIFASSSPIIPLWEQDLPKERKQYMEPPSTGKIKAITLVKLLTDIHRDVSSVTKSVKNIQIIKNQNKKPIESTPQSSFKKQTVNQTSNDSQQQLLLDQLKISQEKNLKEIMKLAKGIENSSSISAEILYSMSQLAGIMDRRIGDMEEKMDQLNSVLRPLRKRKQ